MTHLIIGSRKLDRDIRNMSEGEAEKNLVRTVIDTNQKLDDIPPLEGEEEAAKRQQEEQGLKILFPQQMITRLPILLAQLK